MLQVAAADELYQKYNQGAEDKGPPPLTSVPFQMNWHLHLVIQQSTKAHQSQ